MLAMDAAPLASEIVYTQGDSGPSAPDVPVFEDAMPELVKVLPAGPRRRRRPRKGGVPPTSAILHAGGSAISSLNDAAQHADNKAVLSVSHVVLPLPTPQHSEVIFAARLSSSKSPHGTFPEPSEALSSIFLRPHSATAENHHLDQVSPPLPDSAVAQADLPFRTASNGSSGRSPVHAHGILPARQPIASSPPSYSQPHDARAAVAASRAGSMSWSAGPMFSPSESGDSPAASASGTPLSSSLREVLAVTPAAAASSPDGVVTESDVWRLLAEVDTLLAPHHRHRHKGEPFQSCKAPARDRVHALGGAIRVVLDQARGAPAAAAPYADATADSSAAGMGWGGLWASVPCTERESALLQELESTRQQLATSQRLLAEAQYQLFQVAAGADSARSAPPAGHPLAPLGRGSEPGPPSALQLSPPPLPHQVVHGQRRGRVSAASALTLWDTQLQVSHVGAGAIAPVPSAAAAEMADLQQLPCLAAGPGGAASTVTGGLGLYLAPSIWGVAGGRMAAPAATAPVAGAATLAPPRVAVLVDTPGVPRDHPELVGRAMAGEAASRPPRVDLLAWPLAGLPPLPTTRAVPWPSAASETTVQQRSPSPSPSPPVPRGPALTVGRLGGGAAAAAGPASAVLAQASVAVAASVAERGQVTSDSGKLLLEEEDPGGSAAMEAAVAAVLGSGGLRSSSPRPESLRADTLAVCEERPAA